jgi:DNA polymerase-3 subunit delta'
MSFSGILGQGKAINLLSRALDSDRLAHAYLFSGPEGVGKFAIAKAMAAGVFCLSRQKTPCGECGGCVKFQSGNHPDFMVVSPEGAAIKIAQIRELKKALTFSPFEAKKRVVVLEDVHTMRREAGNSLLKLLEEPPPDNLLLLLSSESELLLPTIVSRCQVIPFYPLSIELTADVVQQRQPEVNREQALLLADLADGSPGRALAMDSLGLLDIRKQIISELLTAPKDSPVMVEKALLLAEEAAELQDKLASLFDLLQIFLKETMIFYLGGKNRQVSSEIERARERWNLEQLSDKVQAIEYALRALDRNCNRALVCEVLFLKLLNS